jgi:hypothetical protein
VPDPITALENFDRGAPPVPALPPAEVRRRGNRMRRRRQAGAGVAAVAVVAALGSGVVALQGGPSTPPITPSPTGPPPATAPAPDRTPDSSPDNTPDPNPKGGTTHLTPDGYGALRLGMTAAQARATGLASSVVAPAHGGCGTFELRGFPPLRNGVDGYISPTHGVEAVFARPGITTPEGIGPGSTVAAAEAAYPRGTGPGHGVRRNGYLVVALDHGREYEFALEGDGTVGETAVRVSVPDCFG